MDQPIFRRQPSIRPTVFLNNDVEMPTLGFGVYGLQDEYRVEEALKAAVNAGYRLIDTASSFRNEEAIGRAIARCGILRKHLFITSKVWNNAQTMGDISGALSRTLERLHLNYLDLYLIHWPVNGCFTSTWHEMEKLYARGVVRAIGVCNFSARHLDALREVSDTVPAVNQLETHPFFYQKSLIEECEARGIVVQASCPLARGAYLDNDIMCVLATKYGRTPAQIGLRWALQKGVSIIPRSQNPDHIRENACVYDFAIDAEDMAIIDTMNENRRIIEVPEDIRL